MRPYTLSGRFFGKGAAGIKANRTGHYPSCCEFCLAEKTGLPKKIAQQDFLGRGAAGAKANRARNLLPCCEMRLAKKQGSQKVSKNFLGKGAAGIKANRAGFTCSVAKIALRKKQGSQKSIEELFGKRSRRHKSEQSRFYLLCCENCLAATLAEGEGFEPPDRCRSSVFKTDAIDHSANLPCRRLLYQNRGEVSTVSAPKGTGAAPLQGSRARGIVWDMCDHSSSNAPVYSW